MQNKHPLAKTMEYYVRNIKLQLGAPVLKIEIDQQLQDIVLFALDELKRYMKDVQSMTLPYQQCIDLSDKRVSEVVNVFRSQNKNTPFGFPATQYYRLTNGYTPSALQGYARSMLIQQNKSTISTDLTHFYDKLEQKLYVYAQYALPTNITIMYIPIYEHVSDIVEEFWIDYLKRLSIAHAKVIVGRIRSKYESASSSYKLDGRDLVSEGNQELNEIRTYLQNNLNLTVPMD